MSKLIRIINNEEIELMDISDANDLFQTYDYSPNEIFYKLRTQINVFDLYYANEEKDKEIEKLNKENKILEEALLFIWKAVGYKKDTIDIEKLEETLKELKEGKNE